jgi:hypothetical protein
MSEQPEHTTTSARRTKPDELRLPGMLCGATIVVAAFALLAVAMNALKDHLPRIGPGYEQWLSTVAANDVLARIQWAIGDMTEPQFYKSWLASLGLLAGAAIAWWAGTRNKRWAGMSISYGKGVWPWILGSSVLSLALSNLAFGWLLKVAWQPTFVPFVCVATSLVLVYGRGWPVFFTGAVMGAVTTTPVAILLIKYVTGPLDLPAVVSNTAAMSVGSALTFVISRYLPWMPVPPTEPDDAPDAPSTTITGPPATRKDAIWTIRRIIADFTETQFYATEWASIGVLAAVVLTFLLNPDFPAYGSGLLAQVLFAQALTAAVGVVVWRRVYRHGGWAPTYISVVSVAPATVLAFNGSALSIIVGSIGGALLCPAVARPISARLPKDFHPFIGNTISMSVCTAAFVAILSLTT